MSWIPQKVDVKNPVWDTLLQNNKNNNLTMYSYSFFLLTQVEEVEEGAEQGPGEEGEARGGEEGADEEEDDAAAAADDEE